MKRFLLAAVFSALSLGACAQPASSAQSSDASAKSSSTAQSDEVKIATPAITAGTSEARVRDALTKLNPRIGIDRIGPAPFPGFREVVASGQVVYVSDDGRYLFQGGLLDIDKRKDLSEAAMSKVRTEVLKAMPVSDRIVFAPVGKPKHTVVVLTDIECGYCRKFHSQIADYNKLGIEVQYMAFPRAGIGSPDFQKMVAVWCADDRRKALTDAKNDHVVAMKTCANPVTMQHAAGTRMGLTGTPMILTPDGVMLGGYLPPEALQQRLDQLDAEHAARKGA
ncbi:DsbC family protein [Thermomonas sp.]|uniref:DsbC family protein n=1 Tax=Thermomonas sp. TaxID=1971895 RepID=UPI0024884718|nr:DsbC family protein [Thermomonas sp.]MDI1254236.1 DsbC family protein [Thermomonas sp.]